MTDTVLCSKMHSINFVIEGQTRIAAEGLYQTVKRAKLVSTYWVGKVRSVREKSLEILCRGWELNPGHGEDRQ